MKKLLAIVFLCFWSCVWLHAQTIYTAKVYDGINFAPVREANVFNISRNKYTFTDKNGEFSIEVGDHDTIVISKSIYRQIMVYLDPAKMQKKNEAYFLYCKAVMLKEVKVYGLSATYEGFKNQVINIKIPEAYDAFAGTRPTKTDIENAKYGTNKTPNILANTKAAHPITFLYNAFSRRAKMQRLYNEMKSYEDELDNVQNKYNRDLVMQLTGLQDADLLEFMVYCHFSYYDLIRMSPEQIVKIIKEKFINYEYYKALQEEDDF